MRSKIRRIPWFPLLPFVPLSIFGGLVAIELFTLRTLRKLTRAVDELSSAPRAHAGGG